MNRKAMEVKLEKFQDWITKHYSLPDWRSETSPPSTDLIQLHRYPSPEHFCCKRTFKNQVPPYTTVLRAELIGRFMDFDNRMPCIYDEPMHKAWQRLLGPSRGFPSFYRAGPRAHLAYDLRSPNKPLRVGILTAGGVAPGLNTVIHHVVRRHELYTGSAKKEGIKASDLIVYGFRYGFNGLAKAFKQKTDDKEYVYLISQHTEDRVTCYHTTIDGNTKVVTTSPHKNEGGSILGVGRGINTMQELEDCATTLAKEDIDILYCIGGNGTAKGAYLLAEILTKRGARTQICVIPKTIDNDVLWAEYSFGVKTAVDRAVEAVEAMHCEARATGRVAVVELMGAKSGFIAANTSLASAQCDLCLIPEVHPVVDVSAVVRHLNRRMADHLKDEGAAFAVIVIAEGCKDAWVASDVHIAKGEDASAAGRLHQLLAAADARFEGKNVVIHRAGYVVRSCAPNPSDRLLCRRLASLAVDNALAGFSEFVITPTALDVALVPLKLVAGSDVGGLGGPKMVNRNGRFWAEVATRNEQEEVDRACLELGSPISNETE